MQVAIKVTDTAGMRSAYPVLGARLVSSCAH